MRFIGAAESVYGLISKLIGDLGDRTFFEQIVCVRHPLLVAVFYQTDAKRFLELLFQIKLALEKVL